MGPVNWLAVLLGAGAFWIVGAIWYGMLFGRPWMREVGFTEETRAEMQAKGRAYTARLMILSFLLELVVAWMLGHLIARTSPQPHVVMMFALGFGAFLMTPAIGINYLYQNRSFRLFAIDAGHFVVGMAAMGGVFVLLG